MLSSGYAIAEAKRNLTIKKPESLKAFSTLLDGLDLVPEANAARLSQVAVLGLDSGDIPILAAALGRAEFLVTGDRKHFGPWMGKIAMGLKVMSFAQAVEFVAAK